MVKTIELQPKDVGRFLTSVVATMLGAFLYRELTKPKETIQEEANA